MKPRTRARSLALQVLYEIDLTDHPAGVAFQERLDEVNAEERSSLSAELAGFARQIVFGILPIAQKLDQAIAHYAPEWPFDQIAAIDRNILRIAAWEFAVSQETPVKVAINEAVELAKLFGADNAPRFVNGVLGTLANHQSEISQQFGKG